MTFAQLRRMCDFAELLKPVHSVAGIDLFFRKNGFLVTRS